MTEEAYTYLASKTDITKINPTELRSQLLRTQIDFEKKANREKSVFSDRGTIDIIGFGTMNHVAMSEDLIRTADRNRYDIVFMVDPLPEQAYRQNAVRLESYGEALNVSAKLEKEYIQRGYTPSQIIHIPAFAADGKTTLNPEQRAAFLLAKIPTAVNYQSLRRIPHGICQTSKMAAVAARRQYSYREQAILGCTRR